MARQMLLDAYHRKKTVRPPWAPYAGVHCAFLINEPPLMWPGRYEAENQTDVSIVMGMVIFRSRPVPPLRLNSSV